MDDLSPILALYSLSRSGNILPSFFSALRVVPAKSQKEFKNIFFPLDLYVSFVGAASMNITQICVCSTVIIRLSSV